MATYLITYDLRKPGQNYDKVWEYIKKHRYAHLGGSAWLIDSNQDATSIRNDINRIADSNDIYYVFGLNGVYAGNGSPEVNAWIAARFG